MCANIEKENILLRRQACPMSASIHWKPEDDTDKDIQTWLVVYNKLPYQIRVGLVDEKTEKEIVKIAKKYNLYKVGEVGEISRIIRDSFVIDGFNEADAKERIISNLRVEETAMIRLYEEMIELRKKIGNVQDGGLDVVIEKMPVMVAMDNFPEISNQLIGEKKIVLSETEKYEKPSIENWINDYTSQKGAQAHNNLERSDYIFNSKNVEKLTFEEKQKLAIILESYDEEEKLSVDVKRKIFLFDSIENNQKTLREEASPVKSNRRKSILGEFPLVESENKDNSRKEEGMNGKKDFTTKDQSKHIINLKDI